MNIQELYRNTKSVIALVIALAALGISSANAQTLNVYDPGTQVSNKDSKVQCHETDEEITAKGGEEWQKTPLGRSKRYATRSGECAKESEKSTVEAKGYSKSAEDSAKAAVAAAASAATSSLNADMWASHSKMFSMSSFNSAANAQIHARAALDARDIAVVKASESELYASNAHKYASNTETFKQEVREMKWGIDEVKAQLDQQQPFLRMALDRVFQTSDSVISYADRMAQNAQLAANMAEQRALAVSMDSREASDNAADRVVRLSDQIPQRVSAETEKMSETMYNSISTAVGNAGVWMTGLTLLLMIFLQAQSNRKKDSL